MFAFAELVRVARHGRRRRATSTAIRASMLLSAALLLEIADPPVARAWGSWLVSPSAGDPSPSPGDPSPSPGDTRRRQDDTAVDLAGSPPRPPAEGTPAPEPSATSPGQQRPLPVYSGRPPPPARPAEIFVWVPRTLLLPAHLVAEYVLRRPLVGLVRLGEKHHLWARLYHLATWNDGRAGVYPFASLDLGQLASGGLALFAREAGSPRNDLRASVALGRDGVLALRASDHLALWQGSGGGLFVRGYLVRRPDGSFFGPGGNSRQSDRTYFSYDDRAADVGIDARLAQMSTVALYAGYRRMELSTDTGSPERTSIAERYGGPGQPPLPPGFEGYRLLRAGTALVLDSRSSSFEERKSTGLRLEAGAGYARETSGTEASFATWNVALAGFWDASGADHVLALQLVTLFAEPIAGASIPFTELPSLGGRELMRGFLAGRLRDRSAVAATLQYRYPVWSFLDGELFAGVGNVFPGHLQGLRPSRLYLDCGAGLRTTFSREDSFVLTIAFGSRRFDDPEFRAVDAVRVLAGVNHGF
jgi:hypothetical protein